MLSVARHRLSTEHPDEDPERFEWLVADAARMPLSEAAFDVATSAFMLQLVDDRAAVWREILRVLRPGGTFAMVTWLADDDGMAADDALDDVVAELELEDPESDRSSSGADFVDVASARAELLAAGFSDVEAGPDTVDHAWSRAGYLDFKERFDERDLFESLDDHDRTRLRDALATRWADLPEDAFRLHGPLVWATARRRSGG